ncbi:hypothetical protein M413DRAFT_13538 [Hebeloma cylindrosporum]|uniref:Uncharacterized protein n=1 Tax=Hebeloma cylindrosporum TaxID=76867 RepID=A0A0C2Y863_HEBCY|nr:hypothetical protein M413DRAFT_13538 [Hebeloma cylindrosporum h7]
MKLVTLFAIALSFPSIAPSLASYRFDSTHMASRDWADEPFNLDAREYRAYDESLEDVLEREDSGLWERSPNEEENFLYPRAPTEKNVYAFEMTFPLTDKQRKPLPKETPEQKRLREMQIKLGYSHKALLVGTVTANKDFVGELYHLIIKSKFAWDTLAKETEWIVKGGNPLVSKGQVKPGWTTEKIVNAGNVLNHSHNRKAQVWLRAVALWYFCARVVLDAANTGSS